VGFDFVIEPPWLVALVSGRGVLLPATRAATRISAFAYGNILVLSVVVAAGPGTVESGSAALLVLGTTVSTFFAHVFAEWLAHGVKEATKDGPSAGENAMDAPSALRDAVPIVSSGALPFLFLTLAYFDVLTGFVAQICAAGGIVFRLGVLGLVIERVQSGKVSWRPLAAGIAVAVVAAVVTVVKVVLTH
jgi:hypothetical protein